MEVRWRRLLHAPHCSDFFTWMEVLLGGEADLLMCNSASGYNYGGYLVSALKKAGFADDEVGMLAEQHQHQHQQQLQPLPLARHHHYPATPPPPPPGDSSPSSPSLASPHPKPPHPAPPPPSPPPGEHGKGVEFRIPEGD